MNVHGVKEGQYMRTLRPQAHDLSFTVELVSVGCLGHLTFTGHNQECHSLHVFTLNGRHLASVNTSHRVTGETIYIGSKLAKLYKTTDRVLPTLFIIHAV